MCIRDRFKNKTKKNSMECELLSITHFCIRINIFEICISYSLLAKELVLFHFSTFVIFLLFSSKKKYSLFALPHAIILVSSFISGIGVIPHTPLPQPINVAFGKCHFLLWIVHITQQWLVPVTWFWVPPREWTLFQSLNSNKLWNPSKSMGKYSVPYFLFVETSITLWRWAWCKSSRRT